MAYCRWSSDNWKCDVYSYESHDGGYITHVASMKRVGDIPTYWEHLHNTEKFLSAYKAHNDALDKSQLVPIGLKHDGETFTDYTLQEFRARLEYLRDIGYNVPSDVFETIDEEIKEEENQ
jgi:hypothetical protein